MQLEPDGINRLDAGLFEKNASRLSKRIAFGGWRFDLALLR
jgi:hypothetical protein